MSSYHLGGCPSREVGDNAQPELSLYGSESWPGTGLTPGGSVPKPQGQCAKLTPLGDEFTNGEAI